ncbi:ankyrin repeat-containing domain protein, partial [Baffinella frigidus]
DGELISAAGDGKLEEVRTLIRAGADINEKDEFGSTPLHAAARHKHLEVVRILLGAGADKNAKDEELGGCY